MTEEKEEEKGCRFCTYTQTQTYMNTHTYYKHVLIL